MGEAGTRPIFNGMKPEIVHHSLVRVSTTDTIARVRAESAVALDERALDAGPMAPEGWIGNWWLWEELLVAAAGTSLLETFQQLAKEARLPYGAFRCTGEAIYHEENVTPLSRLVLRVELEAAPEDLPRAESVLRDARDRFVLAKALQLPVDVQVTAVPSGAGLSGAID